jgi:galactokinase
MGKPIAELRALHRKAFPGHTEISFFSCPGRINLIGEHIDYNGGHVFPAAIDKKIYMAISRNEQGAIRLNDVVFNARRDFAISDFGKTKDVGKIWLYPFGALSMLGVSGKHGFDISYYNMIPSGAGVSSSAAITVVTLFATALLSGRSISGAEMARMGQRVEKEYAGVSCGIMDQFAVIHGRKNEAMILDTRDLSYEYVTIDSEQVHFILVNSDVKHSLRESEYNTRRRECEEALALLQATGAKIAHLCDLDEEGFDRYKGALRGNLYKRAVHAVSENSRSIRFLNAMKRGSLNAAGELLYESHESLRANYEVSIPELDIMVEWTREINGVFGARMMGGGFGGCSLNMVERDKVKGFTSEMRKRFEAEYGKKAEVFDCTIDDGVKELKET